MALGHIQARLFHHRLSRSRSEFYIRFLQISSLRERMALGSKHAQVFLKECGYQYLLHLTFCLIGMSPSPPSPLPNFLDVPNTNDHNITIPPTAIQPTVTSINTPASPPNPSTLFPGTAAPDCDEVEAVPLADCVDPLSSEVALALVCVPLYAAAVTPVPLLHSPAVAEEENVMSAHYDGI